MGANQSYASSTQISNANLMQRYNGTCNITCENTMTNASINIVNSQVGGNVELTQKCAVDAQCTFNVSQDALTDVLFKASNSTTAAGGISTWGTYNYSESDSYQSINQSIQQSINQKCNIKSINDMNNVSIYAANSQIGGNVQIGQTGDTVGACTLQASMSATAMAQGTSDNCAAAGKGKKVKKSCGGKGGKGIGSYILYVVVAIVIFSVIMMGVRLFKGSGKLPPCPPGLKPGNPQFPCALPPKPPGGGGASIGMVPSAIGQSRMDDFDMTSSLPAITEGPRIEVLPETPVAG